MGSGQSSGHAAREQRKSEDSTPPLSSPYKGEEGRQPRLGKRLTPGKNEAEQVSADGFSVPW